jgi:AcrR family transcriptional regulator
VARLRERRLAGSRQEILDATRGVLATTGLLKLTLEAVAAELGISKQALYYYFPSRDALLFDLGLDELVTAAEAVNRAAVAAPDGAGALEAIIRTYVGHFLPRLELHRLVAMQAAPADVALTPAQLERVRPVNDLLYGEAERKLAAEARGKKRDKKAPRRLAFTAHLSAMGMLAMRAITERQNDPLLHSDDELLDELCRTYRAAAAAYARAS